MSQQYDPRVSLPFATIYLAGRLIKYLDGTQDTFTKTERFLFLHLLKRWLESPNGFLQTWELLRIRYPNDADEPDGAEHNLAGYMYSIRKKLKGSSQDAPNYVKNFSGKGYQLDLPQGCCNISVKEVDQLILN